MVTSRGHAKLGGIRLSNLGGDVRTYIHTYFVFYIYRQTASLACAVRLANARHLLEAALRASQRITLRDWQT